MADITEDISGDVEEDVDQAYEQILGEIGLEPLGAGGVPTTKLKGAGEKNDISDLEKQLQNLKD